MWAGKQREQGKPEEEVKWQHDCKLWYVVWIIPWAQIGKDLAPSRWGFMLGSHCQLQDWNAWSLGKQVQLCKISCALTHPAPSPLFSTSLTDMLHQWEQPSVPGCCPARARGSAHTAARRAHTTTLCSVFPLCCSRQSNNFLCKFGNKLLQAGTF